MNTEASASGHTKHLQAWEIETLEAVVDAALAKGWFISVSNGGDGLEITHSSDRAAILDVCGASGEDVTLFYELDKDDGAPALRCVGWVQFIYGNEPGVTIADHTGNEAMGALWDALQPMMEAQETKFADAY